MSWQESDTLSQAVQAPGLTSEPTNKKPLRQCSQGLTQKNQLKQPLPSGGILERTRYEENTAGVSDDGDYEEKFQKPGHHNAPFPTALPAAQLENAGPRQTVPFFLTGRRAQTGKDGAPWSSNSWRSQVAAPHQVETKRSAERKASPCPEPPARA
ncbi:hypothetical protein LMG27198_38210 [Methylocystis echinoides]|uniref:Uncharacterized protein n=1 Tax=Methylocystis echinoides TaxID=29468 RepID=A0A9W6GXI5_9HYPH|nr:hypothetical protein LMG27198_38210 [Methylocystis echinoides]